MSVCSAADVQMYITPLRLSYTVGVVCKRICDVHVIDLLLLMPLLACSSMETELPLCSTASSPLMVCRWHAVTAKGS